MWWWIAGMLAAGAAIPVFAALMLASWGDDEQERIRDEMVRRDAVARAVESARLRD